jgi:hypothetical protein
VTTRSATLRSVAGSSPDTGPERTGTEGVGAGQAADRRALGSFTPPSDHIGAPVRCRDPGDLRRRPRRTRGPDRPAQRHATDGCEADGPLHAPLQWLGARPERPPRGSTDLASGDRRGEHRTHRRPGQTRRTGRPESAP